MIPEFLFYFLEKLHNQKKYIEKKNEMKRKENFSLLKHNKLYIRCYYTYLYT